MSDEVDLDLYLARIGVSALLAPNVETLATLHRAHVLSIPFENLDIFLGRAIRTDLPSVFAKLVRLRRGGYCFEHNALFAGMLERVGFSVARLGARVGSGDVRSLKRTHMILRVGEQLADVGFGAGSLFEPISIEPGAAVTQHGRTFRVQAEDGGRVLQVLDGEAWKDQYHFTLDEMFPSDYVVANHYTSTHPDSGFVRTLTAQHQTLDVQWTLRNWTLSESRAGRTTERTITDEVDLLTTLSEIFGLSFPPGTTFKSPYPEASPSTG